MKTLKWLKSNIVFLFVFFFYLFNLWLSNDTRVKHFQSKQLTSSAEVPQLPDDGDEKNPNKLENRN